MPPHCTRRNQFTPMRRDGQAGFRPRFPGSPAILRPLLPIREFATTANHTPGPERNRGSQLTAPSRRDSGASAVRSSRPIGSVPSTRSRANGRIPATLSPNPPVRVRPDRATKRMSGFCPRRRKADRRKSTMVAGIASAFENCPIGWDRPQLAQPSLSAIGWERQQRDGYYPFAKPARKGRFLRNAVIGVSRDHL